LFSVVEIGVVNVVEDVWCGCGRGRFKFCENWIRGTIYTHRIRVLRIHFTEELRILSLLLLFRGKTELTEVGSVKCEAFFLDMETSTSLTLSY
jgi:hypothetical protein